MFCFHLQLAQKATLSPIRRASFGPIRFYNDLQRCLRSSDSNYFGSESAQQNATVTTVTSGWPASASRGFPFTVQPNLATGRLAHGVDVEGAEISLWALYPPRRLLSARVSAVLDQPKSAFPTGEPQNWPLSLALRSLSIRAAARPTLRLAGIVRLSFDEGGWDREDSKAVQRAARVAVSMLFRATSSELTRSAR